MGTTPKGLPYPEPTGYVRDGASAIRALAEAVDDALGGDLFRCTVTTETIANNTDDRLELTLAGGDSPNFENLDGNLITYTGPKVPVAIYGQVTFEGDNVGTRRVQLLVNGTAVATVRFTADADPITIPIAWADVLESGDKLGLQVWQNSGGPLDVTAAKFRGVVLGVSP